MATPNDFMNLVKHSAIKLTHTAVQNGGAKTARPMLLKELGLIVDATQNIGLMAGAGGAAFRTAHDGIGRDFSQLVEASAPQPTSGAVVQPQQSYKVAEAPRPETKRGFNPGGNTLG